jgi:peptidoglycan/LPS O-acetylase OafA/YrhL
MRESQTYRKDIDGLRAIAIIPVLLYHLNFRYTPGGFIGVDIFFVISGFLITQHIAAELEAGRFSLTAFYERRIRRIFPALVAMLLCATVFAYLLLLPLEMVEFSRSLLAAVLSVSNIYFWLNTDYFQIKDIPLLHTWSLGVEEQFYVVLPLTLMFLDRFCKARIRMVICLIAGASFVLSALTVSRFQEAAFYLLPQRSWELLLGSILALRILPDLSGRVLREICAAVGLGAIIFLTLRYSRSWTFPGPLALLPCVGAVLIIETGRHGRTIVSRILSTGPLVGVGLISYSVYLWHLPILVFQDYFTALAFGHVFSLLFPSLSYPQAVTMERIAFLFVLSLLIGALSWKFIEQPIRFGKLRPARKTLFSLASAAASLLVLVSVSAILARGLPARFSPRVVAIGSYDESLTHLRRGSCFVSDVRSYDAALCLKFDPARPNWLLLGDSHAAQLSYGLSQTFPGINFLQWTVSGCKPVPTFHFGEREACTDAVQSLYREFLPSRHLDGIILAANWQSYDLPRLDRGLQTLNALGQHVVLIGPIMHYDVPLRRLLAKEVESGDTGLAGRHRELSYDGLDSTMALRAKEVWKVDYFSYEQSFCDREHCKVWSAPDVPFQWDESHMGDGGSLLTAQSMRGQGLISNSTSMTNSAATGDGQGALAPGKQKSI